MDSSRVIERIFVVGCPRSGTTLLQSLLAANSQMVSFPETHFYERMIPGRKLAVALGLAPRRARRRWKMCLHDIRHEEMQSFLPPYAIFVSQYSAAFIRILDTLCLQQGHRRWLEKTPAHIRRIPEIQRLVPDPRFVHILRAGEDVIASMFNLGSQYPQTWGPWYGTLDQCVDRWVRDVRISQSYAEQPNHRLVRYDELLRDPRSVVQELCEFLEIPFEDSMLTEYARQADELVHRREHWKDSVKEPIWNTQQRRFHRYLDESQQQYIHEKVPADLANLLAPVSYSS